MTLHFNGKVAVAGCLYSLTQVIKVTVIQAGEETWGANSNEKDQLNKTPIHSLALSLAMSSEPALWTKGLLEIKPGKEMVFMGKERNQITTSRTMLIIFILSRVQTAILIINVFMQGKRKELVKLSINDTDYNI